MAVAGMAAKNHYTIGALFKGIYYKLRVNSSAAHNAHCRKIGGIFFLCPPGGIGAGIRTPVAQKTNNFRFKTIHLNFNPAILLFPQKFVYL
jgi:hypothetical protein